MNSEKIKQNNARGRTFRARKKPLPPEKGKRRETDSSGESIESVVGGAEHVDDFVLVEFLQHVAGGTEILAGVEFRGLFHEDLADASGHGETAVGVDVDLADGGLGSFAELVFADADGVLQLAAVLVDHLHVFLRDGGGAVEDDRESGDALFDLLQDVEADAGIRAGFELVGADCLMKPLINT